MKDWRSSDKWLQGFPVLWHNPDSHRNGIPLMMPGENAGEADGPLLGYLKSLQAFDRRFPGFTHDTHGVEVNNGDYEILCIKK